MFRQRTSYPGVARLLLASTLIAFGCGFALGLWTTDPLARGASGDHLVAAEPWAARPARGMTLAVLDAAAAEPPPALTRAELPPVQPLVSLPDETPAGPPAPEPELHAALPPADATAAIEPEPASRVTTEEIVVRSGDTLIEILQRAGVDAAEAHAAVTSLEEVYDPRRLRAGQQIAIELESAPTEDGGEQVQLAGLSLGLSFEQDVRLSRDQDAGFAAATVDRPLERETALSAGSIDDSLYLAAIRAGLPEDTLIEMIRLFSWDVDFQREIQPGDAFEALFERVSTPDGSEVRGGGLLFATLTLSGRALTAYRFERTDGTADYYDKDGRSLRKSLLRTPVDGARLSSRYGPRRHPVLGYNRMHRGIDFAAPTGTPIYAAGEGTIVRIGRNGGFGNYVRIRHNGEYETAYAHLKGFAKGLKRGSRVKQGQVIAYLGSTGVSTGPHLHYEVLRNGEQINPLDVKQTAAAALTGAELERFRTRVAEIDARRKQLARGTRLAQKVD